MKSLTAVALALLAIGTATPLLAQTAPAAADPSATLPSEQPAGPTAEQIAAHKSALEKTIAALRAKKVDYTTMSEQVANAVRSQEEAMTPALLQMGEMKSVEYAGVQQGSLKFKVTFENTTTTWFIALNAQGKIEGLVVRGG